MDSPDGMLEPKHHALLNESARRRLPSADGVRLCFQLLATASAIDRDCARRGCRAACPKASSCCCSCCTASPAACRRMNWPSAPVSRAPPLPACSMGWSATVSCGARPMRSTGGGCRCC